MPQPAGGVVLERGATHAATLSPLLGSAGESGGVGYVGPDLTVEP